MESPYCSAQSQVTQFSLSTIPDSIAISCSPEVKGLWFINYIYKIYKNFVISSKLWQRMYSCFSWIFPNDNILITAIVNSAHLYIFLVHTRMILLLILLEITPVHRVEESVQALDHFLLVRLCCNLEKVKYLAKQFNKQIPSRSYKLPYHN